LDYFRYQLKDAIVTDPLSSMLATLFPATGGNTCAANAALAARFTFTGTGCAGGIANVARVRTELQNGASITTEGLDLIVNYRTDELFGAAGRFGLGGSATWTLQNRISDIYVAGVLVQPSYDGVGLLNYQTTLYPVPEWKGQAFIDFGAQWADARIQVNYIDGLRDQRADAATGPFSINNDLGGVRVLSGADIDEFVTVDVNLQIQLPGALTLVGTVTNLLDEDPPFAREDYSYEPFIGNPLGRTFKIGFTKKL
jgi:iron complex outermembrane recepter protein